jgi:signal transduction histidine kinase/CheY-like chemotaxis protein/HPt (histidine-containing phosphotransfer) domain-containing protein
MRAKGLARTRLRLVAAILPVAVVVVAASALGPRWIATAAAAASLCTWAWLLIRRSDGESTDTFAACIAHEIRTPLTSILGFSEVLLELDSSAGERREALHAIRRNSHHLLELITGILDLSKIKSGQVPVEQSDCNLPELIAQVVGLTRPTILSKGLEFKLSLEGAVPQRIRTDPLRARQVLLNLIANATRFTERGSIELRIGCRPVPDGNGIMRFAVIDSGIGMTGEQASRLFRPFVQADPSVERRFGGTGLGLTIARSLARLLGGDIDVASEPGKGSTFTAEIGAGPLDGIPMIDGLALPEPGETAPDDEPDAPAARLSGRILLAEDGVDTQRLIARHLRRAGASVSVVGTGRDAVERLGAEAFDLVLMDLRMPGLDGYEALARLRAEGRTTPVLALTANAGDGERERCLAAGFDGYLCKPIEKRKLLADLARYLPAARATAPATADLAPDARIVSLLADDPDVGDLLVNFVRVLPGKVRELQERLARRDLAGLREAAHQIKGAAGGYGFPHLSDCAGRLETQAQSPGTTYDAVAPTVATLVSLMRRVEGYSRAAEHPPRRDVA